MTLTKNQRRVLGVVLARGGLPAGESRGTIARAIRELRHAGLVEFVNYVFYATAAGCVAFGPEIARVS